MNLANFNGFFFAIHCSKNVEAQKADKISFLPGLNTCGLQIPENGSF